MEASQVSILDTAPSDPDVPDADVDAIPYGSWQTYKCRTNLANALALTALLGVGFLCVWQFYLQSGARGADGLDGAKGITGDKGPKGDTGDQGPQGFRGADGSQGAAGPAGTLPGPIGPNGFECWDKVIQNYECDVGEDFNGDGECDIYDCIGPIGPVGNKGPTGDQGVQGPPGVGGGFNCFDLNGNGINDPEEDINGDGFWNALDCLGVNCWDRDGDRYCNVTSEDRNGDGQCTQADCIGDRGPQGVKGDTGATGPQGFNGTAGPKGDTGPQGLMCWDRNSNGVCDPSEDINNSTTCTPLDCQGIQGLQGQRGNDGNNGTNGGQGPPGEKGDTGPPGAQGIQGPQGYNGTKGDTGDTGPVGPRGYACWDLSQDGFCNVTTEDRNGDGVCTVADCTMAVAVGVFPWNDTTGAVGYTGHTTLAIPYDGAPTVGMSACFWRTTQGYTDMMCSTYVMTYFNATFVRIPVLMNTSIPAYQTNTVNGDTTNTTHISIGYAPILGDYPAMGAWNTSLLKTSNARRFNVQLSRKGPLYGLAPDTLLSGGVYPLSVAFRIIYNNLL